MAEMIQQDCDFCSEADDRFPDTAPGRMYPELRSRLVTPYRGLMVVPSLGQQQTGHLLAISNLHRTSMGAAFLAGESSFEDLLRLQRAVEQRYGRTVMFEHGTCDAPEAGGCGLTHAHAHIVPLPFAPAVRHPLDDLDRWVPSDDLATEMRKRAGTKQPYLMVSYADGAGFIKSAKGLPSQYMRRWLAGIFGWPLWDWRTMGRQDSFLETLKLGIGPLEVSETWRSQS